MDRRDLDQTKESKQIAILWLCSKQDSIAILIYRDKWHHLRLYLGDKLWFQVVPTLDNTTPAVIDAYEKYKMLDMLTK